MHDLHKLPIGPQHAMLKEPTFIKLELDGTEISDLKLSLGYAHKGFEKMLQKRDIDKALLIVEHLCGLCSYSHSGTFIKGIENKLPQIKNNEKVKYSRMIVAELERIHSHLAVTGVLFQEMGLNTLFMFFWREREKILELFDILTGNRVHHAINYVGTVRRDFSKKDLDKVKENLLYLRRELEKYTNTIYSSDVIISRLENVGSISRSFALKNGLVGPVLRATGERLDIRKIDPYEAYADFDFEVQYIKNGKGCAYSRLEVRLNEIQESIDLILNVIDRFPYEQKIEKYIPYKIEDEYINSRLEAPRGELFHFMAIKNNFVERLKIRVPTYANLPAYFEIFKGYDVADVPVILASMDPCFTCMERILVVKDGKEDNLSEGQFRKEYCVTEEDKEVKTCFTR